MPTVVPIYTDTVDTKGGQGLLAKKVVWFSLMNGDVGLPISANLSAFVDRSFQVEGTFGTGGTVIIEGANNDDGSGTAGNFHTLTDPNGNQISLTAAGLKQVTEAVINMRPNVTAGDGNTLITVTAFLRRSLR